MTLANRSGSVGKTAALSPRMIFFMPIAPYAKSREGSRSRRPAPSCKPPPKVDAVVRYQEIVDIFCRNTSLTHRTLRHALEGVPDDEFETGFRGKSD